MLKKTFYLLFLSAMLFAGFALQAQVPQRISYQAVVRSGDQNAPVANTTCTVRVSILPQSESGTPVYIERHTATTNANGLLTLAIGGGSAQSGAFTTINWSTGPYFVKIEIDPSGGSNYTISYTTQLFAVPYSFYSQTAETINGTVPYSKITGVPAGFSNNYKDLSGLPSIRDSISTYGFSGNYKDLSNLPNIKDSVTTYGFSGNYNDLKNLPTASSTDYNSLANRPSFNDSIVKYGFDGNYNSLTHQPSFNDSIVKYGFDGDYKKLTNPPSFNDSIVKYGFDGNYNDLTNRPSFSDSIAKYGFDGDYEKLTNLPNIMDSIAKYVADNGLGNNGSAVVPAGTKDGDILYWSNNSWNVLPIGMEGQFLAVANGKPTWIEPYYANTNASIYQVGDVYVNSTTGNPEGVVIELSLTGRYAKIAALTESPAKWDPLAIIDIFNTGYAGTMPVVTNAQDAADGMNNMMTIKSLSTNLSTDYPAFAACQTVGTDWYLPAKNELQEMYDNRDALNAQLTGIAGAQTLDGDFYWSSTESPDFFAYAQAFNDFNYAKPEGGTLSLSSGAWMEALKAQTATVRPIRRLSWVEASSKPVGTIYAIGDIFYENSLPVGVVYEISNGGAHGKMLSLAETQSVWASENVLINASDVADGAANAKTIAALTTVSNYAAFNWAGALGVGWYLPSIEEMVSVFQMKDIINEAIAKMPTPTTQLGTHTYWSSTEGNATNAQSVDFSQPNADSAIIDSAKSGSLYTRAVRVF